MVDISQILLEEQIVACSPLHDLTRLSWLDPSKRQNQPLTQGSHLDLPLWLAKKLHDTDVAIELPRYFHEEFRRAIDADPAHAELRQTSEYYFEIGTEICLLLENEREDLGNHLLKAFVQRFHKLLDAALNATPNLDTSIKTSKLTAYEKQLFDAGRLAMRNYTKWRCEKQKIEQSQLVGLKRKSSR
mmetsp:Transcript_11886/g.20037  ORF Transcript_11886/g.20037 Transcript_11886/m.20037 type:complete len:187 (+) Transcript_11886:36-596(+)|eukprot:CAMPEP_0119314470 /NCGR_PEP_ID=MMETSP1333-20130426/32859_1 /TAXON_ID=418940 /ORGANISM="Scyphosphaera apsteinii, Strain RCC1455" /LENGTH=186 /DNA_ID=CAMNT_0007319581 /DNA_START=35 /DNA_END=595 /DNA_ORIENTATION=+